MQSPFKYDIKRIVRATFIRCTACFSARSQLRSSFDSILFLRVSLSPPLSVAVWSVFGGRTTPIPTKLERRATCGGRTDMWTFICKGAHYIWHSHSLQCPLGSTFLLFPGNALSKLPVIGVHADPSFTKGVVLRHLVRSKIVHFIVFMLNIICPVRWNRNIAVLNTLRVFFTPSTVM